MNRAILASLCGSAIALIWVSHTYFPSQWHGLQSSQSAHNTIVKAVLESDERFRPTMTLDRLDELLQGSTENLQGQGGNWQFDYDGVFMVLVTSESHDRMRLVAPIIDIEDVTPEQQQKMLIANFHSALDARYAIGSLGGQPAVVAVFLHPLSSLHEDHFHSALDQVSQSVQTFGTTYSSGDLLLTPSAPGRSPTPDNNPGENVDI